MRLGLAFAGRDLAVELPVAGPVDCNLSVDPATHLLVAYDSASGQGFFRAGCSRGGDDPGSHRASRGSPAPVALGGEPRR